MKKSKKAEVAGNATSTPMMVRPHSAYLIMPRDIIQAGEEKILAWIERLATRLFCRKGHCVKGAADHTIKEIPPDVGSGVVGYRSDLRMLDAIFAMVQALRQFVFVPDDVRLVDEPAVV